MAADESRSRINVEVAYATPEKQRIVTLTVEDGCTVEQAIKRSNIREEFPDLEVNPEAVGIFSRKVSLDQRLRNGDRVEIYRSLIADPKESRRARAKGGATES
ncbi:MAG: RnfH family protein [Gammaproteobacteria bacterium]|nr:RnfH family protein [Gammaproteobacteria bacterium]